jgi:hypothetical protein
MVASALAAEVTGAIRGFGSGIDTQGRALGTSVRNLVVPAGVRDPSRRRLEWDLYLPPVQLLARFANAVGASASLLGSAAASPGLGTVDASSDWVIVDKSITRC